MNTKPIRTEQGYQTALTEIEGLMDAQPGTPEFDRLDVLATLVSAYEAKHYPIPLPDPISAIAYAMQSRVWSRKQLEEVLNCSSGRVSEIMNRKRSLTIGMIRKLHEALGISLEINIRDYALEDAGGRGDTISNGNGLGGFKPGPRLADKACLDAGR